MIKLFATDRSLRHLRYTGGKLFNCTFLSCFVKIFPFCQILTKPNCRKPDFRTSSFKSRYSDPSQCAYFTIRYALFSAGKSKNLVEIVDAEFSFPGRRSAIRNKSGEMSQCCYETHIRRTAIFFRGTAGSHFPTVRIRFNHYRVVNDATRKVTPKIYASTPRCYIWDGNAASLELGIDCEHL